MSTPQRATASNTQDWKNDIFSCCSPGKLCILTTCCPCITYGETQHRIHESSYDYSCCNSSCIVYAIAVHLGLQCFLAFKQRQRIRKRLNIEGNCFTDFCWSCSCTCCVLMQNEKESKQIVPTSVSTPYRPNGGMVYGQQSS